MLEIFLLIYLSRQIGNIAREKGHSVGLYKFLTVVFWIFFEVLGAIVGILILGEGLGMYLFALIGAVLGYGLLYLIVNNLADKSGDANNDLLDKA
jgi:hypothetical protein